MILDGRRIAESMLPDRRPDGPRAYLLTFYPELVVPPDDHVNVEAAPLVARVNGGVWIASCDCGAPDVEGEPSPGGVIFLDRPIIWCVRCRNVAIGGAWRRAIVPDSATVALIESVLNCRASIGHRNWEPDETVAELVDQNRAHGDAVPQRGAVCAPRERDVPEGV